MVKQTYTVAGFSGSGCVEKTCGHKHRSYIKAVLCKNSLLLGRCGWQDYWYNIGIIDQDGRNVDPLWKTLEQEKQSIIVTQE